MPTELSGQMYRVFRYETLFLNFCSAEEFMLEKSLRPWNKSVQLDLQLTTVPLQNKKLQLVDPNGSDDSAEYYRMDPVPVLLRVPDSG